MLQIMRRKDGGYVLETDVRIESITDHTGTTSFLFFEVEELEALQNAVWPVLMEHDMTKPSRGV